MHRIRWRAVMDNLFHVQAMNTCHFPYDIKSYFVFYSMICSTYGPIMATTVRIESPLGSDGNISAQRWQ